MIAAAATQSGIWGQTVVPYSTYLLPTGSNIGNLFSGGNGTANQGPIYVGAWSSPITAPNGLIYCFGANNSFKGLVAVCKPGRTSEKSKWFFVYDDYTTGTRPSLPIRQGSPQSGMVFNRKPILAPNGLMYLFPETNTPTSLVTFNPGSSTGLSIASAQATIAGDVLTITSMTSGTFGVGQTISYIDPITSATVTRTIVFFQLDYLTLSTTGRGGVGTYKLNSVVPNNVVTPLTISGSEFPTCTWETETFTNIASTKFSTTLNPTQQTYVTSQFLRGFILAKDGYMYVVPNGPMLVRMAPKNTSINLTGQDRWEVHGFYNGTNTTTNAFRAGTATSATRYFTPRDQFGNLVSKTAPYPTANLADAGNASAFRAGGLDSGVLHPNGKIYLTGNSRWIFILDPTIWNSNPADQNVIYTSNNLALRSNLVSADLGLLREIMLEKPLSTYIAKVIQDTTSGSGATVTISVADANYIYTGMTVTANSGSGSFNGSVIVDSVDKINNTFVAKNTTGADVIQNNFVVNDTIQIAPTQAMIENVKMFVFPNSSGGQNLPPDPLRRIYSIDPVTNTIYAIGDNLPSGLNGSNPKYSILPAIFPNGLISKNATAASNIQNFIFTGSDYPITGSQNPSKMLQVVRQTALTKNNSIISGYFGGAAPFYQSGAANSLAGGTTFSIGSSVGKVIYPSSADFGAGSGEFISLKGYSAFTRYFNYAPSDKDVYEPPADLFNDLATSLYNSYVNKLH